MEKPRAELPVRQPRKCGDCSACCTLLAVHELQKARYVKCVHLRQGNRCCSVYANRPSECAGYACAWTLGLGTNAQRPDKLGMVFSTEETALGVTLLGLEVRPGTGEVGSPGAMLGKVVAEKMKIGLILGGKDWRRVEYVPPGREGAAEAAMAKYHLKMAERGIFDPDLGGA